MDDDILNNSRSSQGLKTLAGRVNPPRVEKFLQGLLNLHLYDEAAFSRFMENYGDLLPTSTRLLPEASVPPFISGEYAGPNKKDLVASALRHLAQAWRARTVLAREFALLQLAARCVSPGEEPPIGGSIDSPYLNAIHYNEQYWANQPGPAFDPFLLVILRALHLADRMRYCPNSTCPAPYFIAKRRSQKYCSDACALPAQREFKRAWWAEHGSEWRGKRKAKAVRKLKAMRKKGKK